MKLSEFLVIGGINDKHIFKAVFLAGGPGSGKSFISEQMFGGQGLKFLNSDASFEFLLRKKGLSFDLDPTNEIEYAKQMKERDRAKYLAALQKVSWTNGMLGLILDGTGKDYDKIKAVTYGLRAIGYDTAMVFVNTSLEVALERNKLRERRISEEIVTQGWKDVQSNIGGFQKLFGGQNFFVVDNSESLDARGLQKLQIQLHRIALKWLSKPLQNPVGIQTVKLLKHHKGKVLSDIPEILKTVTAKFHNFIDHNLFEMHCARSSALKKSK